MKAPKRSHDDALVRRLISGAYLDPLTKLFNRTSFAEAVAVGVTRAAAAGRLAAVIHLDIDGFSRVNQALGTRAGDRLLTELGDRLRRTALPADLLARGGGDEFFVFLGDAAGLGELQRRIERFREALRQPVLFDGHELSVSVSLGSAVFPEDGASADALINAAGTALDVCRRLGAGQMLRYTASFGVAARRDLELTQRLRRAAIADEFALVFEPLVDCRTGRTVGAEALLRWTPEPGLSVGPGDFIPVAEQSGLIVPIGRWVLDEACRWLARWRARGALALRVAVNVSARQLHDDDFVDTVIEAAARYEVPLSRLIIELTETAVLEDVALARHTMGRLVAQGAALAIDDFGTGNATLATLQDLPASILKIDRRFVAKALAEKRSRQLLEASVAIARILELRTVAEGIETPEQLALVRRIGGDVAQGFLFTRSLPGPAFERLYISSSPAGGEPHCGGEFGTHTGRRRRGHGLGAHAASTC